MHTERAHVAMQFTAARGVYQKLVANK